MNMKIIKILIKTKYNKNTKTQKHKNTKTQKHKNTKTQKHKNKRKNKKESFFFFICNKDTI